MSEMTRLMEDVKRGNISAAFSLAEGFKWGYFGACDPRRAARMYRYCTRSKDKKTASLGYYNLGVLYYYGYLSPENDTALEERKAFDCFLKSVLAFPLPQALRRLGDMYRYGQYVRKDDAVAMALYVKADGEA